MKEYRLMAIHPNTLGFGYVVLNEKGEILDYGIVTIRPINNEKCLKKIQELISYFLPTILILENIENSKKTQRIKKLIQDVTKFAESKLKIYTYSKEQIRNTFDVFGARNKYEISKKICEVYTELETKLPDKRKPWEPENYYQGLFDAVAMVITNSYLKD